MVSLRPDLIVDFVRNRLPVATSRKQTLLSAGWPSVFTGKYYSGSTLARLVAGIGLVNHVDFAMAADHLAIRVALLGGFERRNNLHKGRLSDRAHRSLSNQLSWRLVGRSVLQSAKFQWLAPLVEELNQNQSLGQWI
jgi:hypothetical protein